MSSIKDAFILEIASYAGWWQLTTQIYIPVLIGFLN